LIALFRCFTKLTPYTNSKKDRAAIQFPNGIVIEGCMQI